MSRVGYRGLAMEGVTVPNKIRKRGCSTSSSPSSIIRNKRTILVGKNRAGLGFALRRSRSSTPVPTWRTTPLRSTIDSPKYSHAGKSSRPVSARSLAATLWEMNQMPSPAKQQHKKNAAASKMLFKQSSGSDPHHSPTVSEKMDRSEIGRRSTTNGVGSYMEMETRSRPPSSTRSVMVMSPTNRLKDASNALTTSKELLKIINRIWGRTDQPSSTMSLIAALHSELERARLHVNHLINDQCSDKDDINYLVKCFAEEKAKWKSKEEQAIQAAIMSIAGEYEMERKSRRRVESLNKKLEKELGEVKLACVKAAEEAEREKRAREMAEKVCDELARNINEVELADKLREERVRMKLSEAKFHFEENNSVVAKLRKQLEVFLQTKDEELERNVVNEDNVDAKEYEDSDLLELNVDKNDYQGQKWNYSRSIDRNSSLQSVSNGRGERNKSVSRLCYIRDEHQMDQSWPFMDPFDEQSGVVPAAGSKVRTADVARSSKR